MPHFPRAWSGHGQFLYLARQVAARGASPNRLTAFHPPPASSLIVSWISDLRERRLVQIILGYGAAGWVVLEVVDQLANQDIVPEVVYAVVLIWYGGGFVASAIIGWFHGERGAQKAPPLEIGLLVVLAAGVGGLSYLPVRDYLERQQALTAAAESSMDLRRVAVRYFEDSSSDDDLEYLAGGLTEYAIARLERVEAVDVLSDNAAGRFRNREAAPASVARGLSAGTVIQGGVDSRGEDLEVEIGLFDGESGTRILHEEVRRPRTELLALREDVAGRIAALLRAWLDDDFELPTLDDTTDDPKAWTLLLRAKETLRRAGDEESGQSGTATDRAYERADELLQKAEALDSTWADPSVMRAKIAYRRAGNAQEAGEAAHWISAGMDHAERALARHPGRPPALALRGALHYLRWRRDGVEHADRAKALLADARRDLERATDRDPDLAWAHVVLSDLLRRADANVAASALAGRAAYEADPYLDSADRLLWTLYQSSWRLRALNPARRWCEEGSRRFPDDPRFVLCRIEMMTAPALTPDPDRAWELVFRLEELALGSEGTRSVLRGRILAAGVLARAELPDSARSVLQEARERATEREIAPGGELLILEAEIRSRTLEDYGEAIDLLLQYRRAQEGQELNPDAFRGWWWNDLRSHPRFREIAPGST